MESPVVESIVSHNANVTDEITEQISSNCDDSNSLKCCERENELKIISQRVTTLIDF